MLPSFDADFDVLVYYGTMPAFSSFIDKPRSIAVELSIEWSELEMCPFVQSTKVYYDDQRLAEITAEPNLRGVILSELNTDHSLLKTIGGDDETIMVSFGEAEAITYLENAIRYCEGCIGLAGGRQIQLNGRGDAMLPLDRPLIIEAEGLQLAPLPQGASEEDRAIWRAEGERLAGLEMFLAQFERALSDLILGPCQLVRDELQRLRYLGPLRETPPRSFQSPRFPDPTRWSSGLGAWDALQTGPDILVEGVGRWLGDADKLNSGYRIERRRFKEIDEANPLLLKLITGRAFDEADLGEAINPDAFRTATRIEIIPDGTDLALQPHDVGIGISQVVPVITTVLDGEGQLVAIEQPELHLHPKLQAELGDLFIEAAYGSRMHQILLETHSEHIILRLLRRVRETAGGELPAGKSPLRPGDLAVYFIDTGPSGLRATRLRVDETGEFVDRWPKGFFDERAKELF